MTCEICKFWSESRDPDYGECRRYAPLSRSFTFYEEEEIDSMRKERRGRHNQRLSDIQVYASWPTTNRVDYCGDFKGQ